MVRPVDNMNDLCAVFAVHFLVPGAAYGNGHNFDLPPYRDMCVQTVLRKEAAERLRLEKDAAEERLRLKAQAEQEQARAADMQEQLLQAQEAARRLEEELQAEKVSLCLLAFEGLQRSTCLVVQLGVSWRSIYKLAQRVDSDRSPYVKCPSLGLFQGAIAHCSA